MHPEHMVLSSLTVLLAVALLTIAMLDLFSRFPFTGRTGAKLRHELDVVMGSLLGLPNFSLIEAIILFSSASLCLQGILSHKSTSSIWHIVLGSLIAFSYLLTCIMYASRAAQPAGPFVIMLFLSALTLIWHITRFLDRKYLVPLLLAIVTSCVGVVVSLGRIEHHFDEVEFELARFRRIQAFCDANPNFEWEHGQRAPVGFPG